MSQKLKIFVDKTRGLGYNYCAEEFSKGCARMSNRRSDVRTHPTQSAPSSETRKTNINPRRFISMLVAVIFVLYFVYTMIWQQVVISKKGKEIEALEEKIAAAEQQTEKLEEELDNLNDPEYLEKIAREKLGLIRPNERVFVDANQSDVNHSN